MSEAPCPHVQQMLADTAPDEDERGVYEPLCWQCQREQKRENGMPNGKKFTKELECKLTEAEVQARHQKLFETDKEIERVMGQKALAVQEFNGDLKTLRAGQRALLTAIEQKTELREVECLERWDERRHEVEFIRGDTGEVFDSRPMTGEERQGGLFEEKPKPDAQAKPEDETAAEGAGGDEKPNGEAKPKRGRKPKNTAAEAT